MGVIKMHQADWNFFEFLAAKEIVYHLAGGYHYVVPVSALDPGMDFGPGRILDTTEIDGRIHYFPKGNA